MGAPWFKVYSQEILSDPKIKVLERDQFGNLVMLLAFANEDECCIPSCPKAIGKLLGIQSTKQMDNQMVWIKRFFVPVDGDDSRLVSIRLRDEQKAYQEKCDKLKANGLLGGRPKKPNGYPDGLPNGNQMAPEEGSKKKEKETTTPTPSGRGRGKGPKVDSLQAEVPGAILEAVDLIVQATPMEDRDRRKIRVVRGEILTRMISILVDHPSATPEILVQAWKDYLASEPSKIKAPQYFFGKADDQGQGQGAHWHPWAKAIFVRQRLANPPEGLSA